MKSLAIDREHRHGTCLELQADLEAVLEAYRDRTTSRDLGRRILVAFEDERQKLSQIVEGQLARSAALPTGQYREVDLPILEQQRMTGENPIFRPSVAPNGDPLSTGSIPRLGTGSHPSGHAPSWDQSGQHATYAQHTGSHASYVGAMPVPSVSSVVPQPASYSHPHTPHSHSGNTGSIAHATMSSASMRQPAQPAQTGRLTLVALAVATAAAGLVALLYFSVGRNAGATQSAADKPVAQAPSGGASSPSPAGSTATGGSGASSAAASPSATPSGAGSVHLKVVVKPKDATVFLDDQKVAKTEVDVPKDGKSHELRVEAPGYTSRTRKFDATDDLTWDLELSPEPRATHVQPRKDPPKDPPKDDGKMQTTKNVRPVDTSYTP
jgi:serine/threonine-protein kinase